MSLDQVLTDAEALPVEERLMLEELLRGRRMEGWRRGTAKEAKKAMRALCSGKLNGQPVKDVIARLRPAK